MSYPSHKGEGFPSQCQYFLRVLKYEEHYLAAKKLSQPEKNPDSL